MDSMHRLLELMARLRDPQSGCPWDRQQTHATLREYILEEAHEVVGAIDGGDSKKICDELGDLLLQIVFVARIAQEAGQFAFDDVVQAISNKLVERHPHIFASTVVQDASEVKANWEKIKMAKSGKSSILSEYPAAMPALSVAQRLAGQASTVGFDWSDAQKALDKVEEECAELRQILPHGDHDRLEDEMGDMLFAVANVARLAGVNPEFALRRGNQKFTRRFRAVEELLRQRGGDVHRSTLEEMDRLWNEVKASEIP
jgi:MazG family protein